MDNFLSKFKRKKERRASGLAEVLVGVLIVSAIAVVGYGFMKKNADDKIQVVDLKNAASQLETKRQSYSDTDLESIVNSKDNTVLSEFYPSLCDGEAFNDELTPVKRNINIDGKANWINLYPCGDKYVAILDNMDFYPCIIKDVTKNNETPSGSTGSVTWYKPNYTNSIEEPAKFILIAQKNGDKYAFSTTEIRSSQSNLIPECTCNVNDFMKLNEDGTKCECMLYDEIDESGKNQIATWDSIYKYDPNSTSNIQKCGTLCGEYQARNPQKLDECVCSLSGIKLGDSQPSQTLQAFLDTKGNEKYIFAPDNEGCIADCGEGAIRDENDGDYKTCVCKNSVRIYNGLSVDTDNKQKTANCVCPEQKYMTIKDGEFYSTEEDDCVGECAYPYLDGSEATKASDCTCPATRQEAIAKGLVIKPYEFYDKDSPQTGCIKNECDAKYTYAEYTRDTKEKVCLCPETIEEAQAQLDKYKNVIGNNYKNLQTDVLDKIKGSEWNKALKDTQCFGCKSFASHRDGGTTLKLSMTQSDGVLESCSCPNETKRKETYSNYLAQNETWTDDPATGCRECNPDYKDLLDSDCKCLTRVPDIDLKGRVWNPDVEGCLACPEIMATNSNGQEENIFAETPSGKGINLVCQCPDESAFDKDSGRFPNYIGTNEEYVNDAALGCKQCISIYPQGYLDDECQCKTSIDDGLTSEITQKGLQWTPSEAGCVSCQTPKGKDGKELALTPVKNENNVLISCSCPTDDDAYEGYLGLNESPSPLAGVSNGCKVCNLESSGYSKADACECKDNLADVDGYSGLENPDYTLATTKGLQWNTTKQGCTECFGVTDANGNLPSSVSEQTKTLFAYHGESGKFLELNSNGNGTCSCPEEEPNGYIAESEKAYIVYDNTSIATGCRKCKAAWLDITDGCACNLDKLQSKIALSGTKWAGAGNEATLCLVCNSFESNKTDGETLTLVPVKDSDLTQGCKCPDEAPENYLKDGENWGDSVESGCRYTCQETPQAQDENYYTNARVENIKATGAKWNKAAPGCWKCPELSWMEADKVITKEMPKIYDTNGNFIGCGCPDEDNYEFSGYYSGDTSSYASRKISCSAPGEDGCMQDSASNNFYGYVDVQKNNVYINAPLKEEKQFAQGQPTETVYSCKSCNNIEGQNEIPFAKNIKKTEDGKYLFSCACPSEKPSGFSNIISGHGAYNPDKIPSCMACETVKGTDDALSFTGNTCACPAKGTEIGDEKVEDWITTIDPHSTYDEKDSENNATCKTCNIIPDQTVKYVFDKTFKCSCPTEMPSSFTLKSNQFYNSDADNCLSDCDKQYMKGNSETKECECYKTREEAVKAVKAVKALNSDENIVVPEVGYEAGYEWDPTNNSGDCRRACPTAETCAKVGKLVDYLGCKCVDKPDDPTPEDPTDDDVCGAGWIVIDDTQKLQAIGNLDKYPISGNYCVTKDITFTPGDITNKTLLNNLGITEENSYTTFIPLAQNNGTAENPFMGKIRGNGHIISNLQIEDEENAATALFVNIGKNAEVSNLVFDSADITGNTTDCTNGDFYAGVLAGINNGSVSKIKVKNSGVSGCIVGMLIGYNRGSIDSSAAIGEDSEKPVSPEIYGGGFVGVNAKSITNSYVKSVQISSNGAASGFAGENNGTITACYADVADVYAESWAVGFAKTTAASVISKAFVENSEIVAYGDAAKTSGFSDGTGKIENAYVYNITVPRNGSGFVNEYAGEISNVYAITKINTPTQQNTINGFANSMNFAPTNVYWATADDNSDITSCSSNNSSKENCEKINARKVADFNATPSKDMYTAWSNDVWCFNCSNRALLKGMPEGAPDTSSCATEECPVCSYTTCQGNMSPKGSGCTCECDEDKAKAAYNAMSEEKSWYSGEFNKDTPYVCLACGSYKINDNTSIQYVPDENGVCGCPDEGILKTQLGDKYSSYIDGTIYGYVKGNADNNKQALSCRKYLCTKEACDKGEAFDEQKCTCVKVPDKEDGVKCEDGSLVVPGNDDEAIEYYLKNARKIDGTKLSKEEVPTNSEEVLSWIGIKNPYSKDGKYCLLGNIIAGKTLNDDQVLAKIWPKNADGRNEAFNGTFEGNNFLISKVLLGACDPSCGCAYDNIGFFSSIGKEGKVKNLNVQGDIKDGSTAKLNNLTCSGIFVGKNEGTLEHVSATGTLSAYGFGGGLVGCDKGTITNSYVTNVNVTSTKEQKPNTDYAVGGFVGKAENDNITSCYAKGDVSVTGKNTAQSYAGGFIGLADNAKITKSATQNVTVKDNMAGGFIGKANKTTIKSAFADTVKIVTTALGSGFICETDSITISNAYAKNIDFNGDASNAGFIGKSKDGNEKITNVFVVSNVGENTSVNGFVAGEKQLVSENVSNVYWAALNGEKDAENINACASEDKNACEFLNLRNNKDLKVTPSIDVYNTWEDSNAWDFCCGDYPSLTEMPKDLSQTRTCSSDSEKTCPVCLMECGGNTIAPEATPNCPACVCKSSSDIEIEKGRETYETAGDDPEYNCIACKNIDETEIAYVMDENKETDGKLNPNYHHCVCPDETVLVEEKYLDKETESYDASLPSCKKPQNNCPKDKIGVPVYDTEGNIIKWECKDNPCKDYTSEPNSIAPNPNAKWVAIINQNTLQQIGSTGETGDYPIDGNYCLMNNISLSGSFVPSLTTGFKGLFVSAKNDECGDATKGCTISNLVTEDQTNLSVVGLFPEINGGIVKNVHVDEANTIAGHYAAGCIAGEMIAGKLDNVSCKITGTGVSAYSYAGGLVGICNGCNINNAHVSGSGKINGTYYAGGFVGELTGKNSAITKSYVSEVSVNADFYGASGFVAWLYNNTITNLEQSYVYKVNVDGPIASGFVLSSAGNATISECFATSTLSGTNVAGFLYSPANVENININNCYSKSDIILKDATGKASGFVFNNKDSQVSIKNNYAISDITGNSTNAVYGFAFAKVGDITNSYWAVNSSSLKDIEDCPDNLCADKQLYKRTYDENDAQIDQMRKPSNENIYTDWGEDVWECCCGGLPVLLNINPDGENGLAPSKCEAGENCSPLECGLVTYPKDKTPITQTVEVEGGSLAAQYFSKQSSTSYIEEVHLVMNKNGECVCPDSCSSADTWCDANQPDGAFVCDSDLTGKVPSEEFGCFRAKCKNPKSWSQEEKKCVCDESLYKKKEGYAFDKDKDTCEVELCPGNQISSEPVEISGMKLLTFMHGNEQTNLKLYADLDNITTKDTYDEAKTYCEKEGMRLPNKSELESVAPDGLCDKDNKYRYYWMKNGASDDTVSAEYIYTFRNISGQCKKVGVSKSEKINNINVLCVHDAQYKNDGSCNCPALKIFKYTNDYAINEHNLYDNTQNSCLSPCGNFGDKQGVRYASDALEKYICVCDSKDNFTFDDNEHYDMYSSTCKRTCDNENYEWTYKVDGFETVRYGFNNNEFAFIHIAKDKKTSDEAETYCQNMSAQVVSDIISEFEYENIVRTMGKENVVLYENDSAFEADGGYWVADDEGISSSFGYIKNEDEDIYSQWMNKDSDDEEITYPEKRYVMCMSKTLPDYYEDGMCACKPESELTIPNGYVYDNTQENCLRKACPTGAEWNTETNQCECQNTLETQKYTKIEDNIYLHKQDTLPKATYAKAEKACAAVGGMLPTEEQVKAIQKTDYNTGNTYILTSTLDSNNNYRICNQSKCKSSGYKQTSTVYQYYKCIATQYTIAQLSANISDFICTCHATPNTGFEYTSDAYCYDVNNVPSCQSECALVAEGKVQLVRSSKNVAACVCPLEKDLPTDYIAESEKYDATDLADCKSDRCTEADTIWGKNYVTLDAGTVTVTYDGKVHSKKSVGTIYIKPSETIAEAHETTLKKLCSNGYHVATVYEMKAIIDNKATIKEQNPYMWEKAIALAATGTCRTTNKKCSNTNAVVFAFDPSVKIHGRMGYTENGGLCLHTDDGNKIHDKKVATFCVANTEPVNDKGCICNGDTCGCPATYRITGGSSDENYTTFSGTFNSEKSKNPTDCVKFSTATSKVTKNNYCVYKLVNGVTCAYVGTYIGYGGTTNHHGHDPLILDLNGDGIKLTDMQGGVMFDMGSGEKTLTSWTVKGNTDDAFLCRDIDGNGNIDSIHELFGDINSDENSYENGFLMLAELNDDKTPNANGDQVIDKKDSAFGELRLWIDTNKNGITDSGELKTPDEMGVSEISLNYTEDGTKDVKGNTYGFVSTFKRFVQGIGEVIRKIIDVFFQSFDFIK